MKKRVSSFHFALHTFPFRWGEVFQVRIQTKGPVSHHCQRTEAAGIFHQLCSAETRRKAGQCHKPFHAPLQVLLQQKGQVSAGLSRAAPGSNAEALAACRHSPKPWMWHLLHLKHFSSSELEKEGKYILFKELPSKLSLILGSVWVWGFVFNH